MPTGRVNGGNARYWVLVETGGNQAYIFGANRLRHVVGASDLIRELGTVWVRDAAQRCGAEVVYARHECAGSSPTAPSVGLACLVSVAGMAQQWAMLWAVLLSMFAVLMQVAAAMKAGLAVTVAPHHVTLSTQEAADRLTAMAACWSALGAGSRRSRSTLTAGTSSGT